MTTTEEIQALAEQQLQNRVGLRKALKTLHELLYEGETVLNLGSGVYEGKRGLVVVTEQRVIFYNRSLGSSWHEDFRFSKISSVESVGGMLGNGKLIIVASGNTALIQTVYPKEYAGEVGDYVRSRLAADSPAVAAQGGGLSCERRRSRGAAPPSQVDPRRGPDQRRRVRGEAERDPRRTVGTKEPGGTSPRSDRSRRPAARTSDPRSDPREVRPTFHRIERSTLF